jgi:hypothetical protein
MSTVHTESKPMDAETLEALRGSIAKWEAIVAGTGMDLGGANCPLCRKFAHKPRCAGCPVVAAVGYHGCTGTPYMDGEFHWVEIEEGRKSFQPTHATACEELDFLKSLLPPGSDDTRSVEP